MGIGAPEPNRTVDLPLRRRLLYPLSYWGVSPMVAAWGALRLAQHRKIRHIEDPIEEEM